MENNMKEMFLTIAEAYKKDPKEVICGTAFVIAIFTFTYFLLLIGA